MFGRKKLENEIKDLKQNLHYLERKFYKHEAISEFRIKIKTKVEAQSIPTLGYTMSASRTFNLTSKEVIQMLLDHFGLELNEIPKVEKKIGLKKKGG